LENQLRKSIAVLNLKLSYGIKADKDGLVNINYIGNRIAEE
jgi:hypothetical protein